MNDWLHNFTRRQAPAPDARADAAAAGHGDWSLRLQAAAGDDEALLALMREAAPLDVKLAAIAALSTEAALKSAERELRGHDRRVHRLAKQRHGLAVAQREARTRAAGLIEDARALSRDALIPLNRLVDIDRAWAALDAQLLDAGQRAEYAALMAQMAALTRERADQPLKLKHWSEQAREALAGLKTACAEAASGSQGRHQLAAAGAAARAAIDVAPQEAASSKLLEELARAVDLIPQLDERLDVLEGDARNLAQRWTQLAPLADTALEELLQARFARWQRAQEHAREQRRAELHERDLERQRARREQHSLALSAALDLAEAALADGQLAATHDHLVEIDKLLGAGALAGALRGRIDALQAQYAQLKGWQHWAGGRARDELVQQAEALAAATIGGTADAQAVKLSTKLRLEVIDDMRARWKELDRLGGATSRSLWQRFDAALKTAYEPVARQVAAQRAAREQNLQSRERLLAEIEAMPVAEPGTADGTQVPDWRALAAALDRFQAAWRKLGPIEHTVPKQAHAALVERMASAVQRLEAPLQQARSVARVEREQLIARAHALAAEAGAGARGRDLVDRVRELQTQWQQHARAMPLARGDENALWVEFKTAIDGAFSAREAAFQARDAQIRAHATERAALIERLEALGADTPAAQLKRTLAEVDALWQRAGPAPRGDAQALEARFRQAREAAQRWLTGSAARAWHAICDALQAKLALCEEQPGSADPAAAKAELASRWSALPALPQALEQALARRAGLASAPGADAPLAASTDELLLQLEAAWGLDSPPAFESARRLLKLQEMKAALETRRNAAPPATPEQRLAELLRRSTLDAVQRERLGAVLSALRRRGSLAAG